MKTSATRQDFDSNRTIRVLSLPGRDFRGNPFIQLFCEALEQQNIRIVNLHSPEGKLFQFDILHIHWPEHYVTEKSFFNAIGHAGTMLAYLFITKMLCKKIVWTVHDIVPVRERHTRILSAYLWLVRVLTDAYVFMSPSSADEFTRQFPGARRKVNWRIPHGVYPVPDVSEAHRLAVRQQLVGRVECFLIGYLGDLKPYKNPAVLAYLPRLDIRGRPVKLVVAGAIDLTYEVDEIEAALERIPINQLVRLPERLSDDRLTDVIRATDAVLLPYAKGSNSGFAMLVLSCGQRILGSALPVFEDLAKCPGPPWVHIFDHQAADLSEALGTALCRLQLDEIDDNARLRLRRFITRNSFAFSAQMLCEGYLRLLH